MYAQHIISWELYCGFPCEGKRFPSLCLISHYAFCLHKTGAIKGRDHCPVYTGVNVHVYSKVWYNWRATTQLMAHLEKSMRGNQILANQGEKHSLSKFCSLGETIPCNNSSKIPPNNRTTNVEQISAPFSINWFQSFEHNLKYELHMIWATLLFQKTFWKSNFQREQLIFLIIKANEVSPHTSQNGHP